MVNQNPLVMTFIQFSLKIISGIVLFLFFNTGRYCNAQIADSSDIIRIIDLRGQNPLSATTAAIIASRNDVVVVLIRGGDQDLIDKTTGQLKALVHNGYNRIGVMLCDLKPGEKMPVIGIISEGTIYAVVKNAKPDIATSWKVYNLVRDAYQDNILPKMKSGTANER